MIGPTIEQVDAAVRAVLAGRFVACAPVDRGSIFPGRLLAFRHAEQLVGRTQGVVIEPGTVVTPLARDHLRRHGVEVRLAARGLVHPVGEVGEWGFALVTSHAMAEPLRRELLSRPEIWHDLGKDLETAASWVAGSNGRGAVLLTEESALACWLANRRRGLRSAVVIDADGVRRATASLGANLLVVEPVGRTLFELKNLFETYRRCGAPRPPLGLEGDTDDADRRGDRPGHALAFAPVLAERTAGHRTSTAGPGPAGGLALAWRGGGRV